MPENKFRNVKKVITGQNAVDGAGVRLVREIGHNDTTEFDPFLLLDAFDSTDPSDYIKGFPWHPHRGIETVTYLIEGNIEHGDSMGNKDSILSGDCQWMTAGSGIIHQEMPKASKLMLGTQLWINLPAKDKMVSPKYRPILKNDIPVIEEDGKSVRILSGSYKGMPGAIEGDYVKVLYLDVEVDGNSEWILETSEDHTLFIYILRGEAGFGELSESIFPEKHVLLFSEGKHFKVNTYDSKVRFLLMSGKPLKEPVAWGGPIVMNTREELRQAFEDLNNNNFIKA